MSDFSKTCQISKMPISSILPVFFKNLNLAISIRNSCEIIKFSRMDEKVELLFRAVGDAPVLKKNKFKLQRSKNIQFVNQFLAKVTKCEGDERIYVYIHQAFSPTPDSEIGTLFDNYNRNV